MLRYKIYICEATTLSHTGHSRTWRGEGDKGPGDKTDEYKNDQGCDDHCHRVSQGLFLRRFHQDRNSEVKNIQAV